MAGDLHAHAATESTPEGLSLGELAQNATARGLDYLLVADPNEFTALTDPAFGNGGLTWLIGYQKIAQGGSLILGGGGLSFTDYGESPKDLIRIAQGVRNGNGIVSVGRPEVSRWSVQFVKSLEPEAIEVWRGGPFSYRTPGLHKNPAGALYLYDRLLDHGVRAAVAGGSDTSSRALSDLAGVGQPTTWVCAETANPAGVVRGIDFGRTTISHESPALKGPLLFLESDEDGDGKFEARLGDEVAAGSQLRIRVKDAPAAKVRLITDGSKLLQEFIVDSFDYSMVIEVPNSATWVRAELYLDEQLAPSKKNACIVRDEVGSRVDYCNGALPMLALSSPIYIASDKATP
ncbi:MAG: hypothetical protein QOG54_818 [Actinomycetota bacterium]|jgi:hypothetical protein|nr:hypothetical protein [Actinomycetota bacterium]